MQGCKATDPKDAFFSALERNSEVKNAHEVAAISLVMDNEGSPYTFMDIQLEGDVSLETYDMAVKYNFSLMDIGMKMELYKKGEDALVKMPIVAKYVQMPSELFNIYNPEEMKSLQDLSPRRARAFTSRWGESLQINKKGSDIVASFELDGAATKSFLTDVLVDKILKTRNCGKNPLNNPSNPKRRPGRNTVLPRISPKRIGPLCGRKLPPPTTNRWTATAR